MKTRMGLFNCDARSYVLVAPCDISDHLKPKIKGDCEPLTEEQVRWETVDSLLVR